ncbi:Glycogenin glucosyltransferase [Purpureocillium takamizusanense]|uniref:glycogenin glucosyltransferase n=1 Tax=Purpureocillium takamizusanense TaxID=2060973 RepID=A0A9Q8QSG1_9HYPO|nr:Glycogenin glucosyltransferase [Purpureocillium takamizusanense]UNI24446.1 Glycogenin glucosyltransferase [Purpureocillium takamizusanense]
MATTAAAGGEQVYATLLLSDSYLPGALVLAHSLRDAGTSRKLAVLVTLDAVSVDAITQLQAVYDYILPVSRIRNEQPANLYLMNRADLHSAFTKINLWKQTQFSKIVYIDSDVVAYRAPDELFDLPHAFSAAPDIGWPDLFNTGVMVLMPNMGDFYAMLAMAERGISFDGADQGLLNMHFGRGYNRLSFTYNVTPSAHYQYVPAYRHFQSAINMVHFIGANKPWFSGRNAPHGNAPYDEMVGRWWAVYDRHYRVPEISVEPTHQQHPAALVQYFTKGEFQPKVIVTQPSPTGDIPEPKERGTVDNSQTHGTTSSSQASATGHLHDASASGQHPAQAAIRAPSQVPQPGVEPTPVPMNSWDAQWQPPPADSRPEALNFPSTHYEMSRDVKPFVPPARYPSPPKNMWYEVPQEPPQTQPLRPIFPWEAKQPKPSRAFASDGPETTEAAQQSSDGIAVPSASEGAPGKSQSNLTPAANVMPADPWTSFPRLNAWDDVPGIGRYVEGLQKHRRVRSQGATAASGGVLSPVSSGTDRGEAKLHTFKLTDFPSEVERPSLPVTPAPIRRPSFWGDDAPEAGAAGSRDQHLPEAPGVPAQAEWDPAEQLQKLAKQQSEALLRKLGSDEGPEGEAPPTSVLSPRPVKETSPPALEPAAEEESETAGGASTYGLSDLQT